MGLCIDGHCWRTVSRPAKRAMAQWAAQNAEELLASLQPKWGSVPSAATLYRALQEIDNTELEQRLGAYV